MLVVGVLVLCRHVENAVGVDIERRLNLRNAARRRRDAPQLEHAQQPVVPSQGTLALVDLDFYRRLAIGRRREYLALARRYRRVPVDQLREDAAQRLDAQRQRRYVEQQNVLHFTAQHAALYRRADRDYFVRIDALLRLLA